MSKLPYPPRQEQQQRETFTNHSTTAPTSSPSTAPVPLKRTRAKRSCDFCRKRKSRCDADSSVPCSNCRAWGYSCEFQTVRKKRGPPSVYVDNLEKKCRKMERLLVSLTKMSIKDLERNDFQYDASYYESGVSSSLVISDSSSEEEEDEEDDFEPEMNIEERLSNLDIKDYDSIKYTGHSAGLQFLDHDVFKSKPYVRWPGRDDVVLQMMGQDEVMIVRTDKASSGKRSDTRLDVGISMRSTIFDNSHFHHPLAYNAPNSATLKKRPSKQLSDKMIELYFTHIHPFLPFINKQVFLARYRSPTPSQSPPSILVDALLALALRFSSQHFPNLAKDAKKHAEDLFRKVMKRLRDSHRSRLSHVQAALLMTLYLDMDDGDVESLQWYTLGTAIRMAQDLGLHRACDHWNLPPSEKETRHRVYYTCYVLDRWLGARAGKPLTILDRDFDTTMPSPYEVLDPSNNNSTNSSSRNLRPIYRPFILLIHLSEILGRVLKALYAPKAKRSNSNAGLDDPTILAVIDRRLKNWRALLDEPEDGFHIPLAQKENLQVFYDIVLLLLHRPFIQISPQQFPELETISAESRHTCIEAASDISNILCNKRPNPADADTYFSLCLPTWHVYAMFQSSLVHLSNALHDRNSEQKLQALQRSVASIESHKYLCSAVQAIEILRMLMTVNGLPLGENGSASSSETTTKITPSLSTPLPTYHHHNHHGSFRPTLEKTKDDTAMLPVKEEPLMQSISLDEEYPKSNHLFERMMNCSVVGGITPDIRREVESAMSQQPVNCFLPQPETAQLSMNYHFYQHQFRNSAEADAHTTLGDSGAVAAATHHPSTFPFNSNNNHNDNNTSLLYHQSSLPFTSSTSVAAPDHYIVMSQQQPFTTIPAMQQQQQRPEDANVPFAMQQQPPGWNDWDVYFDHNSLQPNSH